MTHADGSARARRRAFLDDRRERKLLRELCPTTHRGTGTLEVEGRQIVDFSSNDYLGLSSHPDLENAAHEALHEHGTGSGASRLMSGDLQLHHDLEAATAEFKNKEAALLVNSGYQANTGLLPALTGRHDAIVADRLAHASLIDGALLSRAELIRYDHNDMNHLAEILRTRRDSADNVLIVTESVFSMDGDLAPLGRLVELKQSYDCEMLVDEAHATGVFGPHGKGCVEAAGLTDEVEFIMGTFSKALGGFGAYVAASQASVNYLTNSMRGFIYSTALPPAVVASNLAAIKLCQHGHTQPDDLLGKACWLRQTLRSHGLDVRGESQIVPVMVGDNHRAMRAGEDLFNRGFRLVPIRPPTVPANEARLRLSVCSAHTHHQLDELVEALTDVL